MKRFSILSLLIAFLVMPAVVSAVGLGISPSQVEQASLVRGSKLETTVTLSRADSAGDLNFTVQGEGDIADWVTTEFGNTFTFPSGQQRFPVDVIVNVPNDAANGSYTGNVRFISSSVNSASGIGNEIQVSVNALLKMNLTISGDQVLKYEISDVIIPAIEEGWPLELVIGIENQGNVSAAPTKVEIDFYNKYNEQKLSSTSITNMTGSKIASFSQGDYVVTTDTDLGEGQYWARIDIYKDGEVLKNTEVIFDVVPAGSLEKTAELLSVTTNNKNPIKGDLVKVDGVLKNTGNANIIAELVVEVNKDGKLLRAINSEPVAVRISNQEKLSVYYEPKEAGDYELNVFAKFSGIETLPHKVDFYIDGGMPKLAIFGASALGVIILGVLATIGIVVSKGHKTTKGKKKRK